MMAIEPKYYFVVRLSPLHAGDDDLGKIWRRVGLRVVHEARHKQKFCQGTCPSNPLQGPGRDLIRTAFRLPGLIARAPLRVTPPYLSWDL